MSSTSTPKTDTLARPHFKDQYENYIGGEWLAPTNSEYFENSSPVVGQSFTRIPRSTKEDIDKVAPFGGYKKSGSGRENHKMMLGHYHQTKNVFISYGKKALGFF